MTTRTTLTGAVTLDQGNIRVEADEMTIDWLEGKVQRITASGDQARFTRIVGEGKFSIEARAHDIIYRRKLNQIELLGMASLRQEGSLFRSEQILYDINTGVIEAESLKSEGVELIWEPRK